MGATTGRVLQTSPPSHGTLDDRKKGARHHLRPAAASPGSPPATSPTRPQRAAAVARGAPTSGDGAKSDRERSTAAPRTAPCVSACAGATQQNGWLQAARTGRQAPGAAGGLLRHKLNPRRGPTRNLALHAACPELSPPPRAPSHAEPGAHAGPRQLAHARARHPEGASDARGDQISQCRPHPPPPRSTRPGRSAQGKRWVRPYSTPPRLARRGCVLGPNKKQAKRDGRANKVAKSRQVCQTGAATGGSGAGPAAATADPPRRPSLGECSRGQGATQAAPWGPGTPCLAGPTGRLATQAEAASVVDGGVGDPGPSHNCTTTLGEPRGWRLRRCGQSGGGVGRGARQMFTSGARVRFGKQFPRNLEGGLPIKKKY